jgi:D-alanyl-D-alanine carboxypeptidase
MQAFGTTAPGGPPVTAQTHFMIGSITKTFTATALLRLVDQGKVSLSDPISKYVPGVPNGQSITISQLLNHTSGIADFSDSPSFQRQEQANPNMVWTPQQLVSLGTALPPYFPPGGGWKYSNTNYILLGLVIQSVTSQPAAQFITAQVLAPLRLQNTGMATSIEPPAPGAQPNSVTVNAQGNAQVVPAQPLGPSVYWTAGGLYSTVGDLEAWAPALGTGKLLSPATQQARLGFVNTGETIQALQQLGGTATYPLTYGLGIYNLGGILGHDGEINGWDAVVGYLPSVRATFVVLLDAEVNEQNGTTTVPVPVTDYAMTALAQLAFPGTLRPGGATGTPGQPATGGA